MDIVDTLKSRLDELTLHINRGSEFISSESLIDAFIALFTDCKAVATQSEYISNFVLKYDSAVKKLIKLRVGLQDFETITTLATGAVGQVSLVRGRKDLNIYAMKTLKKTDLLTRREAAFFMEERDALVLTRNSVWITSLYAAFQNDENLYLVMEYAPGGSMRSLIQNRDEVMSEEEARFYIAEILLALEELHRMGYIHRDVKPDNCLLDDHGHIKLADFGSCTKMQSNETVGTPDYISPEILKAHEGNSTYGAECDFWSLGIMLYEFLTDELPFYSESLVDTYGRIMNHQKYFAIPEEMNLSAEVQDLLKRLICDRTKRIGLLGPKEIKEHPWFKDLDWDNMRTSTAPFVPTLNGPEDTRYFDDDDESKKMPPGKVMQKSKEFDGKSLPFIGYSYVKNATPQITYGVSSLDLGSMHSLAPKSVFNEVLKSEGLELSDLKKSLAEMRTEKEKLETEFYKLRLQRDQTKKDNEDLESRLMAVKANLLKETKIVSELKDTVTQQKTFELQVSQLKASIDVEKMKFKDAEDKVSNITKQRSLLEVDISSLQAQLGSQRQLQQTSETTIDDLNAKIATLKDEFKLLQSESESFEEQRKTLESDLVAVRNTLETSKASLASMDKQNSALEKEKASMTVDIDNLKRRINELLNERALLHKTIASYDSNTHSATSPTQISIEALKSEIDELTSQKLTLNESFASITKEKAMFELDLSEAGKSLKAEQELHNETRLKLVSFGSKFSMMAGQVKLLEEMKAKFEKATTHAKHDAEKVTIKLKDERKERVAIELRAVETERKLEMLRQDHQALQDKVGHMSVDIASRDSKILDFDIIALTETSLREQIADQKNQASSIQTELKLEIERLTSKLQFISQELTDTTQTYESKIAALNDGPSVASIEQYEFRIATCQKELHDKAALQEDLKHEYNTLSMMYTRMQHDFVDFKQSVNHNFAMVPLETKESRDFSEIFSGSSNAPDSNARPLLPMDDSFNSQRNASAKPSERSFKRISMGLFSKSKVKTGKDHEVLAMKKLDDFEDSVSHERNESIVSEVSSKRRSFMPQIRSEPAIVDFNFSMGVHGTIKVPKGGKVRKGWIQKHAYIKDFRMLLFEREKDMDTSEGTLHADLTAQIFYVRTVSQAELIHASSKEIDSIFKIQIITFDDKSYSETAASSILILSDIKITPATAKLANEIARLKEKVKTFATNISGIEKMMVVASDAHRTALKIKFDDDHEQLRKSIGDLEQLQTIRGEDENQADLEDVIPDSEYVEEVDHQILRIEKEIELSIKTRDDMTRLRFASPMKRSPSSASGEQSHVMNEIDRTVDKLRDELNLLQSGDRPAIIALLERLNEGSTISRINGHYFKLKKSLNKTIDCAACHELIWNGNAYECPTCKLACHKGCVLNVELTCHQGSLMKEEEPLFIMAKDMVDRNRWIAGIDHFRKEYLKLNNLPGVANSTFPSPSPTRQAVQQSAQISLLRKGTKKF